jgi:hypothetical protein
LFKVVCTASAPTRGILNEQIMVQLLTTGPIKGKQHDCYLMVYIHSRFIVGGHARANKSAVLAAVMMEEILGILGWCTRTAKPE